MFSRTRPTAVSLAALSLALVACSEDSGNGQALVASGANAGTASTSTNGPAGSGGTLGAANGAPGGVGQGAGGNAGGPGGSTEMGATGMGATGMGATGMGATGMGATGMGATGMGATGMGATGVGATGMGGTDTATETGSGVAGAGSGMETESGTGGAGSGMETESGTGGAGGSDATTEPQGPAEPEVHIYLALGQSNMQGAAFLPDEPISHERVQVMQSQNCPQDGNPHSYGEWREMFPPLIKCEEGERSYPGKSGPIGLGPADSFAVAMAEAAGENVTIGIVGAAYGDTSIDQHLPNCTGECLPSWGSNVDGAPVVNGVTLLYDWAVDLGKRAQETGVIKGIIFHQGENDAGQADWPEKVNAYVTALRNDLGLDPADCPFVAGELPYTGGSAASHNPLVQAIPEYVENGHWVSAGPMEDGTALGDRGDGIHWGTESVIEMGERYAAKMLEAQAAGGN